MTVSLIKNSPLIVTDSPMPGRSIIDPAPSGWRGVALMEWELRQAEWTDRHPHEEINFVLEGELYVECEGKTVIAGPGDTVAVHAGSTGRYFAPEYARMLAIYGPNPDGLESDSFSFRDLPGTPST